MSKLNHDKGAFTDATNSDGNTILHITVGLGRNNIVKEILQLIKEVNLQKMVNLDGSTTLHIAAIVGNKEEATVLIKNDKCLLEITDHKSQTHLDKAYQNMHLDTIDFLLKVGYDIIKDQKRTLLLEDSVILGLKLGINLLVNAVSAKKYGAYPIYIIEIR